jgi:hypothetical protein
MPSWEVPMDSDLDLRKALLNGKKSERIIFAVTPELKEAVAKAAEDKCVSVSSYITSLLADTVILEGANGK